MFKSTAHGNPVRQLVAASRQLVRVWCMAALTLALFTYCPIRVVGDDMVWRGATGETLSWHDPANWQVYSTDSSQVVFLTNGGVAEFSMGSFGAQEARIDGVSGTGLLQTGGLLQLESVSLGNGTLQQSGGTLQSNFVILSGFSGRLARLDVIAGDSRMDVRSLNLVSSTERAQVRQVGSDVKIGYLGLTDGRYDFVGGRLTMEKLIFESYHAVDEGAVFAQTGGSVLVRDITEFDNFRLGTDLTEASWVLDGGQFRTSRAKIEGLASALLRIGDGILLADEFAFDSSHSQSMSTLTLANARIEATAYFGIASENNSAAQLDFASTYSVIQTGTGSFVEFGSGASLIHAENATLNLGPDSVLSLPADVDLSSLVGTLVHPSGILHRRGEPLHVGPGEAAAVGRHGPWRGMVVEGGSVYLAPNGLFAEVVGEFRVEAGATAILPRTPVTMFPGQHGGVWASQVEIGGLRLEGNVTGDANFVIDDGAEFSAGAIALDGIQYGQRTLFVGNATVDVDDITLSAVANRMVVDQGLVTTDSLVVSRGADLQVTQGTVRVHDMELREAASVHQGGGRVVVDRMEARQHTYLVQGGELEIHSNYRAGGSQSTIDFDHSDAAIRVVGAVFDAWNGISILHGENATLSVDEHSLIILPADFEPTQVIGNYQLIGMQVHVGNPFTIPTGREIRGSGDLNRSVAQLTVEGSLYADADSTGFALSPFVVTPTGMLDAGKQGYVLVSSTRTASVDHGTLRVGSVTFDERQPSVFQQVGGSVQIEHLDMPEYSTYSLDGGQLHIGSTLRYGRGGPAGTLDFQNSDAVLTIAEGAFVDFARIRPVNGNSTTVTAGAGSLIQISADLDVGELFAVFHSEGIVDVVDSQLVIPSNKYLMANNINRISEFVLNAGELRLDGENEVFAINGEYEQTASGVLTYVFRQTERDSRFRIGKMLTADGPAILDGTLRVNFEGDWTPAVLAPVEILRSPSHVQGEFEHLDLPELPYGLRWNVEYDDNSVFLAIESGDPVFWGGNWLWGDFDGNSVVDVVDVDALSREIGTLRYDTLYDLDHSGSLTIDDLALLLDAGLDTTLGDINLDGLVDSSDLEILQQNLYQSHTNWARGDLNGDRVTDVRDFNVWLTHRTAAPMNSVPEPTLTICGMGLMLVMLRRVRYTSASHNLSS